MNCKACAMKYLIEEKDRHGNVRIYYRDKSTGGPRIRIRARRGTAEFDAAVEAAERGIDLSKKGKKTPQKSAPVPRNTLRWLVLTT